jgi:hypothetical protein
VACAAGITDRSAGAQTPDYKRQSTQQLIDEIATIDSAAPGASGMASYSGFIAGDQPYRIESTLLISQDGNLTVPSASIPGPILELVRRGPDALPSLIAHISDARPTHLVVGAVTVEGSIPFMWQEFDAEYDPRLRRPITLELYRSMEFKAVVPKAYVVKIGDICFAMVGQIVGRQLSAVRYQPTGD